jgi:DNA-binding CsgD family transcriptional regulator
VHTHAVQMQELDLLRGRFGELEARIAGMLAAQPGEPTWLCARACLLARTGRHDEAAAIIEQLAVEDFAVLPRAFAFTYMLSLLAEACGCTGNASMAATLYRMLVPYTGGTVMVVTGVVCRGAVSHYLGLLASVMRRWEDAARHFDDALILHERMRSAPLLASTRCAYAETLAAWNQESLSAGRLNQARTLASAARTSAEALGLTALVDRSAGVLDTLSPSAAVPTEGLSAREVEVLRLLARGATNKEIGAALYLSADTVRQHTINIYRKLDVSGRAEATAWAARHGLLDS